MDLQINKAAAWLQQQAKQYPFSECTVTIVVHDGEIKRVERTVTEKLQE